MASVQIATSTGSSSPLSGMLAEAFCQGTQLHRTASAVAPLATQPRRDESHFLRQLGVLPIIATSDRTARLQRLLRSPDITTAGQLADALALSPVQLKRLCRRLYGVAPKSLLIRHRLARMLATLEQRPYAELRHFLDLGYCDQSHFIRDFKAFFGMAPTRYFAAATR
jgi:AraC-like DNA-binding protein